MLDANRKRSGITRLLQRLTLRGNVASIIWRVRRDKLTYLSLEALAELFHCVHCIDTEQRPGIIVEAGCALGGSALVIATAKSRARSFYVYDVFGMIPPPSVLDGDSAQERYYRITSGHSMGAGEKRYYGYEENLLEKIEHTFRAHQLSIADNNIHLVKGLYADTLHVTQPVALAHIDCDWYESVMTCLQRIEPHIIAGGTIIVDDYDYWPGCRKAVDDYFAAKMHEYAFVMRERLHIIRS